MARAASDSADELVLTDDNPRSEVPQQIVGLGLHNVAPEGGGGPNYPNM